MGSRISLHYLIHFTHVWPNPPVMLPAGLSRRLTGPRQAVCLPGARVCLSSLSTLRFHGHRARRSAGSKMGEWACRSVNQAGTGGTWRSTAPSRIERWRMGCFTDSLEITPLQRRGVSVSNCVDLLPSQNGPSAHQAGAGEEKSPASGRGFRLDFCLLSYG